MTGCGAFFSSSSSSSYPCLLWRLVIVVVPFLLLVVTATTVAADDSCTTTHAEGPAAAAVCHAAEERSLLEDPRNEVAAIRAWIESLEGGSTSTHFRIEEVRPVVIPEGSRVDEEHETEEEEEEEETLSTMVTPEYTFQATTDIANEAILMTIPAAALIGDVSALVRSESRSSTTKPPRWKQTSKTTACDTVQSLLEHYLPVLQATKNSQTGQEPETESETETETRTNPYVHFIYGKGNARGKQPASWSTTATNVLFSLMGDEVLEPFRTDYQMTYFHPNACPQQSRQNLRRWATQQPAPSSGGEVPRLDEDEMHQLQDDGYMYYKKHAYGTVLIPLYDLVPHRNGKHTNVDAKFVEVITTIQNQTITTAAATAAAPIVSTTSTTTTEEQDVPIQKRQLKYDPFERKPRSRDTMENKNTEEPGMDGTTTTTTTTAEGITTVTTTTIHTTLQVVVYATRDIVAGEALYTSYNQCQHLGCLPDEEDEEEDVTNDTNNKNSYGPINQDLFLHGGSTQRLLADCGILEDYPRRFVINTEIPLESVTGSQGYRMIFDIDQNLSRDHDNNNTETLVSSFRWIQAPNRDDELYVHRFIEEQLDRLRMLGQELQQVLPTQRHISSYERTMLTRYHAAYLEAFELLHIFRNHKPQQEGITSSMTTTITTNQGRTVQTDQKQDLVEAYYDPLLETKGLMANYADEGHDWMNCAEGAIVESGVSIGKVRSHYQVIDFFYERPPLNNTYMKLGNWLHSASNFRAHYHEGLIHVPLQYIETVKRVLYVGGGDNMVVSELLKYNSTIELIVGMELDQQVCRSTLKYFGTTPSWDDPRVQWWYGDAAKSLKVIPKDYFGSFDLVIVDLLSFVAETIKVTAGLSIMDIAPLLMKKEGGIVVRNEDYQDRSEDARKMSKHVIEYDFWDLPRLCEQSVTLGSDSIDFFSTTNRYNHGVDLMLRLKDFQNEAFDSWSIYHNNTKRSPSLIPPETSIGGTAPDVTASTTTIHPKCQKLQQAAESSKPKEKAPLVGILMIIEAENVNLEFDDENNNNDKLFKIIEKRLATEAIESNDLNLRSVLYQPNIDANTAFFILDECYIKITLYSDEKYVAFDLMMWNDLDKSSTIKEALVRSVGGDPNNGSTSAFRVVTEGMSGSMMKSNTNSNNLLEVAETYFCGEEGIAADKSDNKSDSEDDPVEHVKGTDTGTDIGVDASLLKPEPAFVITELVEGFILPNKTSSTTASPTAVFVVFCGEENAECAIGSGVDSRHSDTDSVTTVSFNTVHSCASFDDMHGCEMIVQERLESVVAGNNNKRLDGIIIDRSVALDMGKVVHKIFNSTINQEILTERSFLVISPVDEEEKWRDILVDRFRTEIRTTSPTFNVDIEFYNETHADEWCIVSVRIDLFYDHLKKGLMSIKDRSGLSFAIKDIELGAHIMDFNFHPLEPKDSAFHTKEAEEQWFNQKPVAYQTLMQMETVRPLTPLLMNETVLVVTELTAANGDGWVDNYMRGRVTAIHDNEQYTIEPFSQVLSDKTTYIPRGHRTPVDRHLIRKVPPQERTDFSIGDWVLVNEKDKKTGEDRIHSYLSGMVLEITDEGVAVRYHDTSADVEVRASIPPEKILFAAESSDFIESIDPINASLLEEAFDRALTKLGISNEDIVYNTPTVSIGNGILRITMWPEGNAVLKWDGLDHVSVNMFLYEENINLVKDFEKEFLDHFDHLEKVGQDSFPRGYNKVVNFRHEIKDYTPHWILGITDDDDDDDDDDECNEDDDAYECIEVFDP